MEDWSEDYLYKYVDFKNGTSIAYDCIDDQPTIASTFDEIRARWAEFLADWRLDFDKRNNLKQSEPEPIGIDEFI